MEGNRKIWVSPFINKARSVKSKHGESISIKVKFLNYLGENVSKVFQRDLFKGKRLFSDLEKFGFEIPAGEEEQKMLSFYLWRYNPQKISYQTPKLGFHDKNRAYILPQKTLYSGEENQEFEFMPGGNDESSRISSRGTAEEWMKKIGKHLIYSPQMFFGTMLPFTGVVVGRLKRQGFGINFFGDSSIGKSTILQVANSVFCSGKRDLILWNSTKNGMEQVFFGFNHNFLSIDELKMAKLSEIEGIAYTLGNGRGKMRYANINENNWPQVDWRLVVASTGEVSMEKLAVEMKVKKFNGERSRIIDVSAESSEEFGIYEKVPEKFIENAGKFSDYLKRVTKKYYGSVGVEFVQNVLNDKHFVSTIKEYEKMFKAFIHQNKDSKVQKRIGNHFCLVYASAMKAKEYGLIPFSEEEIRENISKIYWNAKSILQDKWQIQENGLNILRSKLSKKNDRLISLDSKEEVDINISQIDIVKRKIKVVINQKFGTKVEVKVYIIKKEAIRKFFKWNSHQLHLVKESLMDNKILKFDKTRESEGTKALSFYGNEKKMTHYVIDVKRWIRFKKEQLES